MQIIYLILAIFGFILPYSQLVPFFIDHGLNLSLFWSQLFANQISSVFAFDLLVSSVVFWLLVFKEGKRINLKFLWLYVVLNLAIGLSFALPVFLWVRSKAMPLCEARA
ncbi:MAG: DUF2834 domain-containing protein [Pleurocapsa sp. MO_226.B13]|nr:DUF2834 domain-containing protein [Pleurocapsa sp. MO_226.B13]